MKYYNKSLTSLELEEEDDDDDSSSELECFSGTTFFWNAAIEGGGMSIAAADLPASPVQ